MKEDDFIAELKAGFLVEALEMLDDAELYLVDLEKNPNDHKIMDKIFRVAHNLKGTSGTVGFSDLADFLHKYEDMLSQIRKDELVVNKEVVDLLLECVDRLKFNLNELRNDFSKKIDNSSLEKKIVTLLFENKKTMVSKTENQAKFKNYLPSDEIKNGNKEEFVRISLKKIDNLVNYFNEQVVLQSALLLLRRDIIRNSGQIGNTIDQLNNLTTSIQQNVRSLRMVAMRGIFSKMKRIIRDTSSKLGKKIEFIAIGEELEIDKTIFDAISSPITHLIRNAIDHGIESPEERSQMEKDESGKIFLKADQDCGLLRLTITDDGRGLDTEKLKKKAIDLKIIDEDSTLTKDHVYDLIFRSGFSTKEEITEISGRGVGMDVVKTQIDNLGGTIKIKTTDGNGLEFIIMLPLSIIDGLLVKIQNTKLVVPVNIVDECFEIKLFHFPMKGNRNLILSRGELIPFIRLRDLFELSDSEVCHEKAVVFKINEGRVAIFVDHIIGDCQAVIKPLGKLYGHIKHVTGVTLLGDGTIALIPNLNKIFQDSVEIEKNVIQKTDVLSDDSLNLVI